jgi:hypothetical protein
MVLCVYCLENLRNPVPTLTLGDAPANRKWSVDLLPIFLKPSAKKAAKIRQNSEIQFREYTVFLYALTRRNYLLFPTLSRRIPNSYFICKSTALDLEKEREVSSRRRGYFSGSRRVNVAPFPGSLSKKSFPPCSLTIFCVTGKPRPVPLYPLVV